MKNTPQIPGQDLMIYWCLSLGNLWEVKYQIF